MKIRSLQSQIGWCSRLQWILGGLLLAGLAAFNLLGYRPLTERLASLQKRVAASRAEVAGNQARSMDMGQLVANVDALRATVDRCKKLPRQAELGHFMKDLTEIGRQWSLRGFDVQPLGSKRLEMFSEMPIKICFEGDFPNASLFLRQIEDLPRLTRVTRLVIDGKSKDAQPGSVKVDMTMNIYFAEGS